MKILKLTSKGSTRFSGLERDFGGSETKDSFSYLNNTIGKRVERNTPVRPPSSTSMSQISMKKYDNSSVIRPQTPIAIDKLIDDHQTSYAKLKSKLVDLKSKFN